MDGHQFSLSIRTTAATAAAPATTAKNQYRFLLRSILINNKRKLTINIIGTTFSFPKQKK